MTFIYNYLNDITKINYYCINDPLIFPLIVIDKIPKNQVTNGAVNKQSLQLCDLNNNKVIRLILNRFDQDITKEFQVYKNKDKDNSFFEVVEVTAFLSSLFAFGSRISIIQFLGKLFSYFSPFKIVFEDFLNIKDIFDESIQDLPYYRWINKKLSYLILASVNTFYRKHKSIFVYILVDIKNKENYIDSMIEVSKIILKLSFEIAQKLKIDLNKKEIQILKNLLPQSLNSTSAKRFNLFLKWMIRRNFPDIGLYSLNNSIFDQKKIFYPLDIHILNLSSIFIKFLIIDSYFHFFKENSGFQKDFDKLKLELKKMLRQKNFLEIIKAIENRFKLYEQKNEQKILQENLTYFLGNITKLDVDRMDEYSGFINYLKEYEIFFINSFKRKAIFMNKFEHLKVITDFYRIFNPYDPLIYDLPLSIIKSPILKIP